MQDEGGQRVNAVHQVKTLAIAGTTRAPALAHINPLPDTCPPLAGEISGKQCPVIGLNEHG